MYLVKNAKIKYIVYLVIILLGIAYLLFNKYGILKYWKLEQKVNELKEKISTVEKQNKILEAEIDSLKKEIPAKIEKLAREKYKMKGKNEQVIKVEHK